MSYRTVWRAVVMFGLALLVYLVGVTRTYAQAQPSGPIGQSVRNRQTVSPYTTLLNGLDPTSNYFNIIVPQQNAQKFAGSMSNELRSFEARSRSTKDGQKVPGVPEPISSGRMGPTGHAATFGDLGGYFPGSTGGGGSRGGPGGGGSGGRSR